MGTLLGKWLIILSIFYVFFVPNIGAPPISLSGAQRFTDFHRASSIKYEEKNWKLAVPLFLKLVEEEDLITGQALYELGHSYIWGGGGISRDIPKALEYLRKSADRGHGAALHYLSVFSTGALPAYIQGNDEDAVKYETLSTLSNHLPAVMGMGYRYLIGYGVEPDCEMALQSYKFAADMVLAEEGAPGLGGAQKSDRLSFASSLALHSQNRQMLHQKEDILAYWEYKAKQGDPMAKYELAKMTENDVGRKSEKLYEEAAGGGVAQAHRELGMKTLTESLHDPSKFPQALQLFLKGGEMGDAESIACLGSLNFFGFVSSNGGVLLEPDITKAEKFFKVAAQYDIAEALHYLGDIQILKFEDQQIPPENLRKALRFYQRAADLGFVYSFWREAQLNEMEGVERSCEAAALNYKMIAEVGKSSEIWRDALSAFAEGRWEEAILRYQFAAAEGFEIGNHNAGWMLLKGKGYYSGGFSKKADILKKAHFFFKNSTLLGDPSAAHFRGILTPRRWWQRGKKSDSFSFFSEAFTQGEPRSLPYIAKEYASIGNYEQSRECYELELEEMSKKENRELSFSNIASNLASNLYYRFRIGLLSIYQLFP